jgi:hypothetical protein
MPWSSKKSLSSDFPSKKLCVFFSNMHATHTAHLIHVHLIIQITFGKEYKSYSPS